VDPDNVHGVLHYDGASSSEPTTSKDPDEGTKLQEHLLRPLENPGAAGGSAPADRVIDLSFTRDYDDQLEVRIFPLITIIYANKAIVDDQRNKIRVARRSDTT
jgi:hypothetical protein